MKRAFQESLAEAREAVNDLTSAAGFSASRASGRKEEVDPIDHMVRQNGNHYPISGEPTLNDAS